MEKAAVMIEVYICFDAWLYFVLRVLSYSSDGVGGMGEDASEWNRTRLWRRRESVGR